ncbi:MAG TPA: response regulator [Herpetosiphonaceae bacterium]|nr:response regulator [Herpetosiphonaceae bacterium]
MRQPDILLIEDSPTQARQYQLWLAAAGYSVEVVHDGAQGLIHARNRRPRLILLDIELPTISGFHVLAWLKSDSRMRGTAIAMLTSHASEQNAIRARQLGADTLISKLTERTRFCELIAEALPPAHG